MFRTLLLAASLALGGAGAASAAILGSGTIQDGIDVEAVQFSAPSGYYRFTTDAVIANVVDLSPLLFARNYVYTNDWLFFGSMSWMGSPWEAAGVAPPVITPLSNGFAVRIETPEDIHTVKDGCFVPWSTICGWTEYQEYRVDLLMAFAMAEGSAGKSWTFEYFELPPPSAIPEPDLWAELIAGFIAAGAWIRRRSSLPYRAARRRTMSHPAIAAATTA